MPEVDSRSMAEEYWRRPEPLVVPGSGGAAHTGSEIGLVTELRPRSKPAGASGSSFPEHLSTLIHDARNMVSAIELYCDLLDQPGVLSASCRHYAAELRRVGSANRRLLEGLAHFDPAVDAETAYPIGSRIFPSLKRRAYADSASAARLRSRFQQDRLPSVSASSSLREAAAEPVSLARSGTRRVFSTGQRVENLADELQANRNLLAAMVGNAVTLGMTIRGGACALEMSGDDLTRVLVNLAMNAAEAMPAGGHLQIALEEGPEYLTLSFTDNGPGIPKDALESIFSPGYSTRVGTEVDPDAEENAWPRQHRGLGLSIVRSLVSAAGGAVWAANRMAGTGACFAERLSIHGAVLLIEFPLPKAGINSGNLAGVSCQRRLPRGAVAPD